MAKAEWIWTDYGFNLDHNSQVIVRGDYPESHTDRMRQLREENEQTLYAEL